VRGFVCLKKWKICYKKVTWYLVPFPTPSQNFLAENFTLPQGEGDDPVSVARFTKKALGYFFKSKANS
jgi:hypothetical protein